MFNNIKSFFRRKFLNRKCLENYRIVRSLGCGSYAEIFQTQYTINKKYYTCKRFPKGSIEMAERELHILRKINHLYFPKYHNYQQDRYFVYLFFDYIPGNDLFNTFTRQLKGDIGGEENLKKFARQMVFCARACELFNIQHLDIKLENFVVTNLDPPQLKLIDFGSAHYIFDDIRLSLYSMVGTLGYLPPEIENDEFHKTSDVWSLGICIWMLFAGRKPFIYDEDKHKHDYAFPTAAHIEIMSEMSPLLRDFFTSIFHAKPEHRIVLSQLIRHKWLD